MQRYIMRSSQRKTAAPRLRGSDYMIIILTIIMMIINYILPVRDDADRYTSARADRDGGGRAWSDRPQDGRIGPGAASARTCSARRTAVSEAEIYTYPRRRLVGLPRSGGPEVVCSGSPPDVITRVVLRE